MLTELGAIDADGRITDEGPKAASPAAAAAARAHGGRCRAEGAALAGAEIAVLIGERGLGGDDVDLRDAPRRACAATARPARAMRRGMAQRWAEIRIKPCP